MREHINLFEQQNEELIHKFMKEYEIKDYKITPQGVDVYEDVKLLNHNLTELPFQFNEVYGSFSCANNKLESLRGAPRVAHGYFDCENNNLKSLEFCPKFVKHDFYCSSNEIPPWEHRYLLFSEVQCKIFTGKYELDLFFERYQNKKHLIPQALKELRLLQIKWEQRNA